MAGVLKLTMTLGDLGFSPSSGDRDRDDILNVLGEGLGKLQMICEERPLAETEMDATVTVLLPGPTRSGNEDKQYQMVKGVSRRPSVQNPQVYQKQIRMHLE